MTSAGRWEASDALRRLATVCGGVREGESCLIVTDTGADQEIVAAVAATLRTLGTTVVLGCGEPVELPGDEPPAAHQRGDGSRRRDLRAHLGIRRLEPGAP